jgi:hypothetical protein
MGKAIVYCQTCGKNLREEDFDRGRAFKIDNRPYCADCRPAAPDPEPAPSPPRRSSSERIPAVRPAKDRPGSTGRIPKAQAAPGQNPALLWISIAVLAAVVVLVAVLMSNRTEPREPLPPVVTPPPPRPPKPPAPAPIEPSPLDRDLQALRRLLDEPLKGWKLREIEALLRSVTDKAGPRRAEVEKLRTEVERGNRTLDLREGLIGRWPLDEAAGAVARDASGRGNDATIVGSPGRVPGRIGGAFQFRGGEDYVQLPSGNEFDAQGAGTYTLAAWFMPDLLPPGKEANANDSWYAVLVRQGMHGGLSLTREGRMEMGHWLADQKQAVHYSIDKVVPKVWTHVAGIVDARTGHTMVFINGKSSGESIWAPKASALPMETPWRIGIASPKASEWGWSAHGLVDEVLFYGRALSPEEVALLAEGVIPPDADPRTQEPSDAGLALHLRSDRDLKLEGTLAVSWSDTARGIVAASDVRDERPVLGSIAGRPALTFDGKNDRLSIPATAPLAFGESESFTLAVRVQVGTVRSKGRWQGLVAKSLDAEPWYGIWISDHNRWVFGSKQNLVGSPVRAGASIVVAVQEGGRERRLYVDGQRVATGPAMSGSGAGDLWIGGGKGKAEFFEGEIQEVRIWRRALSPAEIRGFLK